MVACQFVWKYNSTCGVHADFLIGLNCFDNPAYGYVDPAHLPTRRGNRPLDHDSEGYLAGLTLAIFIFCGERSRVDCPVSVGIIHELNVMTFYLVQFAEAVHVIDVY